VIAWTASTYLWFVFKTTRWTYIGLDEHISNVESKDLAYIAAFWHGRLAMLPFLWQFNKQFYMLLSEHNDGRIISKIIRYFKINSVYGSKTRGGAKAALACVKLLKAGQCIGITPDGPRGPKHEVAEGVLHIARLANVPIVPISYAIKRHRLLKTWDGFMVPLPFTKGVYVIGKPIEIANSKDDATLDLDKRALKKELDQVMQMADSR
jgi:lysophospholipid acyltransferase (LPLAT)-like uncharacterized protein